MRTLASTAFALASLLVAAQASEAVPGCVAPPGTAATDQYCELVVPPRRPGDRPPPSREVPKAAGRRLVRTADGHRLLVVTGPYEVREDRPRADPDPAPRGQARSAFGAVAQAIGDTGVFGTGLILALLISTAGLGAWSAANRSQTFR